MRLNGGLLILERCLILESRSSVVAVMGEFLYYRGSHTQSRHSPTYVSSYYFSVLFPAICTSCIKKQKQKSKEHSGLMDHEGNDKDSDEEKNQNPRFADN